MNKHLDNVCIMQKYNDSEKVLELREKFRESEAFIKKAVNCHDELVEALKEVIKERDFYFVHPKIKGRIEQILQKIESEGDLC